MPSSVTHERDLRSLNRPGLRRAFGALDAGERLPRELVLNPGVAWLAGGKQMVALLWPWVLLTCLAALAWVAAQHFG